MGGNFYKMAVHPFGKYRRMAAAACGQVPEVLVFVCKNPRNSLRLSMLGAIGCARNAGTFLFQALGECLR
jgi:hypothetical protein